MKQGKTAQRRLIGIHADLQWGPEPPQIREC
ncbi:c4adf88d-71c6-44ac-9b82-81e5c9e118ba [Thermothielavioides terrestris]|uniref:C4adf88d-71c6-44ac-9b82-81e5c9e118ba n=1 Tax=Thermothielavioides terrestris TaxID=2587410 RepID=A0A3S4ASI0_9PEZI|nr:c4adf88d-71c6-44ac-9b82-81e5c9e118ba [Thermothielavioides terrestris]